MGKGRKGFKTVMSKKKTPKPQPNISRLSDTMQKLLDPALLPVLLPPPLPHPLLAPN